MSTKTLRKRIALVAVSAMGFGLVSTVAAPSASALGAISPSAITITTPSVARAGVASTIPVTFTLPASFVPGTDSINVIARVVSAPTASASVARAISGDLAAYSSTTSDANKLTIGLAASGSGSYGNTATGLVYNTGAAYDGDDRDNEQAGGEA